MHMYPHFILPEIIQKEYMCLVLLKVNEKEKVNSSPYCICIHITYLCIQGIHQHGAHTLPHGIERIKSFIDHQIYLIIFYLAFCIRLHVVVVVFFFFYLSFFFRLFIFLSYLDLLSIRCEKVLNKFMNELMLFIVRMLWTVHNFWILFQKIFTGTLLRFYFYNILIEM